MPYGGGGLGGFMGGRGPTIPQFPEDSQSLFSEVRLAKVALAKVPLITWCGGVLFAVEVLVGTPVTTL